MHGVDLGRAASVPATLRFLRSQKCPTTLNSRWQPASQSSNVAALIPKASRPTSLNGSSRDESPEWGPAHSRQCEICPQEYIGHSLEAAGSTQPEAARRCELPPWHFYWILPTQVTAPLSVMFAASRIITTKRMWVRWR